MSAHDEMRELLDRVDARAEQFRKNLYDAAKTQGKRGHHNMIIFASRMAEAEFTADLIRKILAGEDR